MDPKVLEAARLAEEFLTPHSKHSLTPNQVRHFHRLLSDPHLASGLADIQEDGYELDCL